MKKIACLFFITFFVLFTVGCSAKDQEFVMDKETKKEFVSALLERNKRFISVEKVEEPISYNPNISIVPVIITARARDGGIVPDVLSFIVVYHTPKKWKIDRVGAPEFLEKEYPDIKYKLIAAGYLDLF